MVPVRKVYLDPGHGGPDPGAVGHGIEEEDITLAVALRVAGHLRRHGLEVRLSRTADVGKTLRARASEANAWGADAFVSIHCNAAASPTAEGFEVWHTVFTASSRGDELARAIVRWLDRLTPLANRGARSRAGAGGRDYYYVIRATTMPAVIVECGFVTSPRDAAYLRSVQGRAAIAEAIARGVVQWAGLAWRGRDAPSGRPGGQRGQRPAPRPRPGRAGGTGKLYVVQAGAFRDRRNAEALARQLRAKGFPAVVVIRG